MTLRDSILQLNYKAHDETYRVFIFPWIKQNYSINPAIKRNFRFQTTKIHRSEMRQLRSILTGIVSQKEAEEEITGIRALPTWLSPFFFAQMVASLHEVFDNERVDRTEKNGFMSQCCLTQP
jgi:hypothetical protein